MKENRVHKVSEPRANILSSHWPTAYLDVVGLGIQQFSRVGAGGRAEQEKRIPTPLKFPQLAGRGLEGRRQHDTNGYRQVGVVGSPPSTAAIGGAGSEA